MDEDWLYQIRVYLTEAIVEQARRHPDDPALRPLTQILHRHRAALANQLDAFISYVAEAEREGADAFPLYRWTKATIDDPVKAARHARTFAVRVGGEEVYRKGAADALEADLRPLVGGTLVERMSRHDTNPANNLQVPAEYRA